MFAFEHLGQGVTAHRGLNGILHVRHIDLIAGSLAAIYRQVFASELALADHDWRRAATLADALAADARRQWLAAMPAVSAMIELCQATAQLGLAHAGDRGAAELARAHARALYRRGRASFYGATGLRLWAQAEYARGDRATGDRVLADAIAFAAARGGALDRLALEAIAGRAITAGELAPALSWWTAGAIGARASRRADD